jgi:RND family efflux transporter MFP subunit
MKRSMHRSLAIILAITPVFATGACKPKEAAGGPPEPSAAALPVDVIVLTERPVRDASEYLATLSSRSSVALYPQVIGRVSKIFVKPGDRVKTGAQLVQIDPSQQQASLDQIVAARKQKEVGLHLAEERAKRATSLRGEGLVSQQDFDQAVSDRESAAADLRAVEAQIQAQASQLKFFTIAAPFDGVVGDIPVKIGDLLTTATKVTSVDQNAVLEAYVNVPVERAPDIGPGSRVELLDAHGAALGESQVTFVADQASPETQSVLIKAVFPNATKLRAAQIVRARVIWSTRAGLLLPTTAVVRKAGQTFAFIAEGEGGAATAKQRAVTLGAIEGNEYVITAGLKPGERVIVSGIQKVSDGAQVAPKG